MYTHIMCVEIYTIFELTTTKTVVCGKCYRTMSVKLTYNADN